MSAPPLKSAAAAAGDTPIRTVVEVWLLLAALGQMAFMAHWPMYVLGVRIGFPWSVIVPLVRLGVYFSMAWGLREGVPGARSAVALEMVRTVLLFYVVLRLPSTTVSGAAYPAPWCQGLLAGALPALVVFYTAVTAGWRPGSMASVAVMWTAALGAVGLVYLAGSVIRLGIAPEPGDPPGGLWRRIGEGLPYFLLLSCLEAFALLLGG